MEKFTDNMNSFTKRFGYSTQGSEGKSQESKPNEDQFVSNETLDEKYSTP